MIILLDFLVIEIIYIFKKKCQATKIWQTTPTSMAGLTKKLSKPQVVQVRFLWRGQTSPLITVKTETIESQVVSKIKATILDSNNELNIKNP